MLTQKVHSVGDQVNGGADKQRSHLTGRKMEKGSMPATSSQRSFVFSRRKFKWFVYDAPLMLGLIVCF